MIRGKPTVQEVRNFLPKIKNAKDLESLKPVLSDMVNLLEHLFTEGEAMANSTKKIEAQVTKKIRDDDRAFSNVDKNNEHIKSAIKDIKQQLGRSK